MFFIVSCVKYYMRGDIGAEVGMKGWGEGWAGERCDGRFRR
jgi:hypothetical protein